MPIVLRFSMGAVEEQHQKQSGLFVCEMCIYFSTFIRTPTLLQDPIKYIVIVSFDTVLRVCGMSISLVRISVPLPFDKTL